MFSIIIPFHNRENEILACLETINQQDQELINEIILIDDASTSPLNLNFEKYPKVRLIQSGVNLGPSYGRNYAALKATGDYLYFLDSDTLLPKLTLNKMRDILKADPKIGVLGGVGPLSENATMENPDTDFITGKFWQLIGQEKRFIYKEQGEGQLIECDHIESASMVIPTKIFNEVGGFDPYWFYMSEDRDICLSIKEKGYKVIASFDCRVVHHELTSYGYLDVQRRRKWRTERILEVAIKQRGFLGGVAYLIENKKRATQWKYLKDLAPKFLQYRDLTLRKKINFLERPPLKKYEQDYIEKNKKLLPTPSNITLFLNNRCNAACEHCFIPDLNTKTYEFSEIELSKMIASLNRKTSLTLTGGEILLNKNLREQLRIITSSQMVDSIGLLSNGFMADKLIEEVQFLLDNAPASLRKIRIQISLDGTREVHDKQRKRKGSFDKALYALEKLTEISKKYPKKLRVTAAITLTHDNTDDTFELCSLLNNKGLKFKMSLVRGNSFSTFGIPKAILKQDYEPQDQTVINHDYEKLRLFIQKIIADFPNVLDQKQKRKLDIMLGTLINKKRLLPCYAGSIDGVIYSNGDIAHCEQINSFTNIKEFDWDISKAWNYSIANQQRLSIRECSCINGCNISTALEYHL